MFKIWLKLQILYPPTLHGLNGSYGWPVLIQDGISGYNITIGFPNVPIFQCLVPTTLYISLYMIYIHKL